jgi:glycosyltransferase involved in cell wall biosynthesis
MTHTSEYPKVLIVAMGKINALDTTNNGLLLRSLFSPWPKEQLAQIFSSGENGDEGFCGKCYRLNERDRRFGKLFARLKKNASRTAQVQSQAQSHSLFANMVSALKRWTIRHIVDTGVYELVFKLRTTPELEQWVKDVQPDVVFAQGYSLTFCLLPIWVARHPRAKLAVLATDDWPRYQYSGQHGEPAVMSWLMQPLVRRAAAQLFSKAQTLFAFGDVMAREYQDRYSRAVLVLNHADDRERFRASIPRRIHAEGIKTILAIGGLNKYRWPLLLDAADACKELISRGIQARVAVMASSIEGEGAVTLAANPWIDLLPDPGHESLPTYLKGADVLLLAEGFDDGYASAIALSISSKAHLFMLSGKPSIVYANSETGVAKYAAQRGWAKVVSHRSHLGLAKAIEEVLTNTGERSRLIENSKQTYERNHTTETNAEVLMHGLKPQTKL